jgi:hypothetical protein
LLETVRLPLPASERVIANQLGWRLRTEYERSWDVDVEYNRAGHGTDPARGPKLDPETRPVDISIHHRGLSGRNDNLLVIELKTHGVSDLPGEIAQLELTKRAYDYQHAVLVDLGISKGEDPEGPPVELNPSWLWLPGGKALDAIFSPETACQLSNDGWQSRQVRYAMRLTAD